MFLAVPAEITMVYPSQTSAVVEVWRNRNFGNGTGLD